jgi:hypothetical protein
MVNYNRKFNYSKEKQNKKEKREKKKGNFHIFLLFYFLSSLFLD